MQHVVFRPLPLQMLNVDYLLRKGQHLNYVPRQYHHFLGTTVPDPLGNRSNFVVAHLIVLPGPSNHAFLQL